MGGQCDAPADDLKERHIHSFNDKTAAPVVLTLAEDADVPAIVALMNRAFRGAGPVASWNSEADYMDGDRTSEAALRAEIAAKPGASLLVWRGDASLIQGSVWLEAADDGAWYLGSLTVDPRDQNSGLGRALLGAAESWAFDRGAREIRMTVVNIRATLIAWYERRGYSLTGENEPFPYDDDRFGTPRRADLHFVVMRKGAPKPPV